jgi:DNA-binding sugar fermentation-stimulating protein
VSHGSDIMCCQSEINGRKLEAEVSSYRSIVLSCIVRHCYQAMTSKDKGDFAFAAALCRLVKA